MATETSTEEEVEEISEDVKVYEWRLLILLDAGYRLGPAITLAKSGNDLHQMEAVKRAGCEDYLAVAIFA